MIQVFDHFEAAIEPVIASKWRNLWFFKDGRVRTGASIFDSEEECHRYGKSFFDGPFLIIRFSHYGEIHSREEISHYIPMPVCE